MKITDLSIRRSLTVFTLMFMVVVIGSASYIGLPRESSPDVKIPFVMVIAPYPGTSPSDMENLVTRKIEQQLKGLPDLKEMSSSSVYGASHIFLEFTTDADLSDALQKVRDRVELAKPELPDDTRKDLQIVELSSSDWPIMLVELSADDPRTEHRLADRLLVLQSRAEGPAKAFLPPAAGPWLRPLSDRHRVEALRDRSFPLPWDGPGSDSPGPPTALR